MRRAFLGLLLVAGSAGAQTTRPSASLGPRYTDTLNGFSLRPPAGTDRIRQSASQRLVVWVRRDAATKAIRWTLEIDRVRSKPSKEPLNAYAKALAARLGKVAHFDIASTRIGVVAGKPAIHFRGVWRGAFKLWRRQIWVRTSPSEHLVLNIFGSPSAEAEMDAIATAVAGTLKLFDPAAALKQRREALRLGAAMLDKVTEKRLREILDEQTQYFTISLKGKTIGFLKITESMATVKQTVGLSVVRAGSLTVPKQSRKLIHEKLFASPDRSVERWRRAVMDGQGPAAAMALQEGIKHNDMILVHRSGPNTPRTTRSRKVPAPMLEVYLPQAFGGLLPRLTGAAKAGTSHGFAMYNDVSDGFDLRTLRVVGAEKIAAGGRTVPASHLTDQMAPDAPRADLWVDAKGGLIRMKTPDGLTIERAARALVIRRFAAELLELDKLAAWVPPDAKPVKRPTKRPRP